MNTGQISDNMPFSCLHVRSILALLQAILAEPGYGIHVAGTSVDVVRRAQKSEQGLAATHCATLCKALLISL